MKKNLDDLKKKKEYWVYKQEIYKQFKHHFQKHNKENYIQNQKPNLIIKQLIQSSQLKQLIQKHLQKNASLKQNNPEFLFYSKKWSQYLSEKHIKIIQQSKQQPTSFYSWKQMFNFIQQNKDSLKSKTNVHFLLLKQRFKGAMDSNNIGFSEKIKSIFKQKQKRAKQMICNQNVNHFQKISQYQIEEFMKKGSPNCYRVQLFMKYFQSDLESQQFQQLVQLDQNQILSQKINEDIANANDQQLFLFSNDSYLLMNVFLKDKSLYNNLKVIVINKIIPHYIEQIGVQCRIFICQKFYRYIAFLFYSSYDLQLVYLLFRQFYVNYFSYLHSISSDPQSIVGTLDQQGLLSIYKNLMHSKAYRLSIHFQKYKVNSSRIVFPWIFYCFIGYMHIEQVYNLFDRIIGSQVQSGYKSLQWLPILSVSIMILKQQQIMQCKQEQQICDILEDISDINFLETVRLFFNM